MICLFDRHPEARSKRREDPGVTGIKKLMIIDYFFKLLFSENNAIESIIKIL